MWVITRSRSLTFARAAPISSTVDMLRTRCWTAITRLQGRTLYSFGAGHPFDVVRVGPDSVVVRAHSTGTERAIPRHVIESFYVELVEKGELLRSEMDRACLGRASSVICAILATLPGVRHATRPVPACSTVTPSC
jgi:hypothetical protein